MAGEPRGVRVFYGSDGSDSTSTSKAYPLGDEVIFLGRDDVLVVQDADGKNLACFAGGCWHHVEIGGDSPGPPPTAQ